MLEKWKQWAVNFPMGKFSESDRDDGREEKEYKDRKEKDWEEISKRLNLSAGDIALMAGCGIIGVWTKKKIGMISFPIADSGGLRYGKANSEKTDFYIQCTDGSGNAFYTPDAQCGCH